MYNISYIAKSVLADIDSVDNREYQRIVKFAIDGYRKLRLSGLMGQTNKTIKLQINTNNVAYLPDDYVDFIKIGINCNGNLLNLDYNEKILGQINENEADCEYSSLSEMQDVLCGCKNKPNGCSTWWYSYPTWLDGQFYGGYYGYGSSVYRGGYKIDLNQRIIAFDSWVKSHEVILEYESNGIEGDSTIIPESAIPVLTAYVHYKKNMHNPNLQTRLAIQPYYQEYIQELKGFRARTAAMTAHDWKQIYLDTFRQSVKR